MEIDNSKHIDVVMPMYTLLKCSVVTTIQKYLKM